MKKSLLLVLALSLPFTSAFAGDHNPDSIIPLLKDSKTSLLEAISYAESTSGPATSAKFEVKDGKLMVSVYTVPEGLGVEPEMATLTELSGDTAEGTQGLKVEVFADKEHIARASVHMTLFQLSHLNLKEVLQLALKHQPGAVIDVRNPMVRNKRPVADVVIAGSNQRAVTVTVDLLNGKTKVQK